MSATMLVKRSVSLGEPLKGNLKRQDSAVASGFGFELWVYLSGESFFRCFILSTSQISPIAKTKTSRLMPAFILSIHFVARSRDAPVFP